MSEELDDQELELGGGPQEPDALSDIVADLLERVESLQEQLLELQETQQPDESPRDAVLKDAFIANVNADGTWTEQCSDTAGGLADFVDGRSNNFTTSSNATLIELNPGQALVLELEEPGKTRYVRISQAGPFSVNLTQTGGSAGNATTPCTFTYTVKDLQGGTLGTSVSPLWQRPDLGKMKAATHGFAEYRASELTLTSIDEVPAKVKRVCP